MRKEEGGKSSQYLHLESLHLQQNLSCFLYDFVIYSTLLDENAVVVKEVKVVPQTGLLTMHMYREGLQYPR